jgi:tetratricopeptide (TPR) repeat protein
MAKLDRASPWPPLCRYVIDCDIALEGEQLRLSGSVAASFSNGSGVALRGLNLAWQAPQDAALRAKVQGEPVVLVPRDPDKPWPGVHRAELKAPLPPGEQVALEAEFAYRVSAPAEEDGLLLVGWFPQLSWDEPVHSDYSVAVRVPDGHAALSSGRRDDETSRLCVAGARSFGLFIGHSMDTIEEDAGGVLVQAACNPATVGCARLLVDTAVDAVSFYRDWLGFYPYRSLAIIPGMDRPAGGYPAATALVAIHGQSRMGERPEEHWRWITAHEIGHQYWGEHVLEKDRPGWLWIPMGIWADRHYSLARGFGEERCTGRLRSYVQAVEQGIETTIVRPASEIADRNFDYNTIVRHDKGYSVISALNCLLGEEAFDRAYRRCLAEFGGSSMGVADFRRVCEEESGRELDWFFEQWVRSDRYLSYRIVSREDSEKNGRYASRVRVERAGALAMPVPIEAVFADGSRQREWAGGEDAVSEAAFEGASPVTEVRLDPDNALAMLANPPDEEMIRLRRRIEALAWMGAADAAAQLAEEAVQLGLSEPRTLLKLSLATYDGARYEDALRVLERLEEVADSGSLYAFAASVWQGQILDLLGRRAGALARYEEALDRDTGGTMRHDQYGLRIDRAWVLDRLEEPFTRRD